MGEVTEYYTDRALWSQDVESLARHYRTKAQLQSERTGQPQLLRLAEKLGMVKNGGDAVVRVQAHKLSDIVYHLHSLDHAFLFPLQPPRYTILLHFDVPTTPGQGLTVGARADFKHVVRPYERTERLLKRYLRVAEGKRSRAVIDYFLDEKQKNLLTKEEVEYLSSNELFSAPAIRVQQAKEFRQFKENIVASYSTLWRALHYTSGLVIDECLFLRHREYCVVHEKGPRAKYSPVDQQLLLTNPDARTQTARLSDEVIDTILGKHSDKEPRSEFTLD